MRLLVVWAEAALGLCAAVDCVREVVRGWPGDADLVFETSEDPSDTSSALGACAPGVEEMVRGYDRILVPLLPDGFIESVASACAPSPLVALVRCALASGCKVEVLASAFGPEVAPDAVCGLPREAALARQDLACACGLSIVDVPDGLQYAWRSGRVSQSVSDNAQVWHGVLGERDVLDLVKQGKRAVRLAADTLVTPLAFDTARERGLALIGHRQ